MLSFSAIPGPCNWIWELTNVGRVLSSEQAMKGPQTKEHSQSISKQTSQQVTVCPLNPRNPLTWQYVTFSQRQWPGWMHLCHLVSMVFKLTILIITTENIMQGGLWRICCTLLHHVALSHARDCKTSAKWALSFAIDILQVKHGKTSFRHQQPCTAQPWWDQEHST